MCTSRSRRFSAEGTAGCWSCRNPPPRLRPALTELLGGQPTIADIGRVGGILSTVGLLGWSLGGFAFGIIADYIGRVRALALSILIYSVFTGRQGIAQSPLDLGISRFFAGVGTGAEIIVAFRGSPRPSPKSTAPRSSWS